MKDFASLTQSEAQAMFDVGQLACIGDGVDATYSRVADKFTVTNLPICARKQTP